MRRYDNNKAIIAIKETDVIKLSNRAEKIKETKNLSWDDMHMFIKWLKEQIRDKKYVGVYGVPRSGLLLAVLLSYETELPLLLTPTKDCLVVDEDIISGVTLAPYYGRYDIAVYAIHPECKMKPTYIYSTYEDAVLISYPWRRR